MANSLCEVLLTDLPLALPPASMPAEAGAIVDFWGVVRATEAGAEIVGIEYECHRSMAEHQLRLLAAEAAEKFELMRVFIHHRIGFVPVAAASLFVRVASRHRAEGFQAGGWIVDELKTRVPIWKHPLESVAAERDLPQDAVPAA